MTDPKAATRHISEDVTGRSEHSDRLTTEITTDARDYIASLHRRSSYSIRCLPLVCGCHDPLTCKHNRSPLTRRQLEAWWIAVAVLSDTGIPGIVPSEVGRLLGLRRRWWSR